MPQKKPEEKTKSVSKKSSVSSKKSILKTQKPEIKEKIEKTFSALKTGATKGVNILNGVVGDRLEGKAKSLSVNMQFFKNKRPVTLTKEGITKAYSKPTSKICILVHGLASDEMMWNYSDSKENYGNLLQSEFGYTPFFLRYNSGLHISENGKNFSILMHTLFKNYPTAIKELVLIGHSMGGLVIRSACYYADKQNYTWIYKIRKIFFLGSPHLGAPLEKFGNVVTNILDKIPNPFTKLTKNVINLRSAGIKDLRFGYLTDEDWKGKDPDAFLKNNKKHVPLMEGVDYFIISGTVTDNPKSLIATWIGDAMVRKPSALPINAANRFALSIPEEHHKEFPGVAHVRLMYEPKIYEQIKEWIK